MSGQSSTTAYSPEASGETTISILNRQLAGRLVKLLVGPERVEWTIHESLLCANSKFFVAALRGPWKERKGVIELPEDEPAAFGLFANWIYESIREVRSLPPIKSDNELRNYLALYIMSRKLLVQALSKGSFSAIYEYFTKENTNQINEAIKPKVQDVHYIFDNTTESDSMRWYFCDLILLHCQCEKPMSLDEVAGWQKFTDDRADVGSGMMRSMCQYIATVNALPLKNKALSEANEYVA
ncbi:hypothetical protein QBC34DRAFT_420730 [Podospora aff. communis PSN243]|uniref:BTB domain-containing protein n=1 Tax=Podospora aff. communis PSN243 TaxID=3040156 RepID=A0AAV9H4A4_9PEZI|nr:hypothetical protein QBC34DRAFT_420730 [Podospora aff. communis PSN243]